MAKPANEDNLNVYNYYNLVPTSLFLCFPSNFMLSVQEARLNKYQRKSEILVYQVFQLVVNFYDSYLYILECQNTQPVYSK